MLTDEEKKMAEIPMRKTIDELTRSEINALNDEEIGVLIDIECAKEGVKFADYPKNVPVEPTVTPTEICYSVAGKHFKTREAADDVAQALKRQCEEMVKLDYEWEYGSRLQYMSPYSQHDTKEIDITITNVFNKGELDKRSEALKRYRKEKDAFDKEKKEYDSYRVKRGKVAESIWTHVTEAREWERTAQRLENELARYRKLADGNEDMAIKFFLNAYQADVANDAEMKKRVLGSTLLEGPWRG